MEFEPQTGELAASKARKTIRLSPEGNSGGGKETTFQQNCTLPATIIATELRRDRVRSRSNRVLPPECLTPPYHLRSILQTAFNF